MWLLDHFSHNFTSGLGSNKISPPFTVNGMSQLCGFISWLFKINYFNNISPHYRHMYLYHPPFKRLSPVSAVCEASSSASRSHFLVPPSFHSSENSTMAEWSCPRSPLSPHRPPCWWCWSWSATPPPPLCLNSQSPFCRQYLSETRNFKVQIFLFTFTKSEIKSSLQSHVHLSVHHNDLLWNSLTLRSTFSMTPIYLRLQKVKTRSTFQKSSSQFQNNPNHLFLKRKSILSIWQIEDFSRRFPTWILHCRLNAFYALPILIQTF